MRRQGEERRDYRGRGRGSTNDDHDEGYGIQLVHIKPKKSNPNNKSPEI